MDRYEEATNQSSHAESRLPQLMLNYEPKSMQNEHFLKVNGDHKVPQHIFPSDDESSEASSHSSSSSPRNLVIDHPDDTSKDGIEDKGHKEEEQPQVSQPGNQLPNSSSELPSNFNQKKNTIKRKLSLRDTTNPSLPKKRRHSAKPMITAERRGSVNVSGNGLEKDEKFNRNVESGGKPIKKRTGPFREYASYLGLKPTTIPIKCFKCSNASFENLSQLRDHQKICLFKDKQRNSSNTLDTRNNANITKHLENLNDGLLNSNSVEMLNSSLGPKQKPTPGLPLNNTTARAKKRVFLCSACGTYYENWNLFLHMREVHKRHICLYCIGMFPSAERLTFHLEMKHDLEQNHFDCQEKLLRSSRDSCYLMCCVCEHLFTEHEDFSDHKCADHQQPCSLCGQKGRHLANCKAGSQSNKSKHKDHYAKRKSKAVDKSISLPNPPADFPLDKTSNAFINGGDDHAPETSILRKIITDRDRVAKRSEDILPIVKTNGCAEIPVFRNIENGGPSHELHHSMYPAVGGIHNEQQSFDNSQFKNVAPMENLQPAQPIENIDPPPPDENAARREEQNKTQESLESSLSQSNTTSDLTSHPNSSPEKELNESLNRSDISETQEATVEPKPLFVPKFKIKIPKEFQTPIESEQSSTESDDNDVDRSDNGDEEQSEASDMDIEEDNAEVSTENAKSDAKEEREESGKEDEKVSEEIASLDDKKILKPEDTLPDQVFSPEKSPLKTEVNESKEELSIEEPMKDSDFKNETDPVEGSPSNKITEADEDIPLQDILLQQPLDKIDMVEFMRICLKVTFRICLYCNHARRIAVNGQSLALHLISQHRFSATVDSITAEELKPTTIVQKLKSYLPDLENVFFNLETFGGNDKENLKPYEKLFECFQCRFETRIHKELYLHNRKMHLKPAILCFMCRSNFFSYSEILCHMCPGVPNKCVIFDIKFRCCLCDLDTIPSAFRLMVHLRKKHFACDVCLEDCYDQSRLSSHVWKHKLHHLCYRCGIAYRNKPDITKHLFWKHGTESVLCKRCLQKRWPHVYHFCIPPASFVCEVCNISFSRAMALKVHKRLHTGDAPYPCPEDGCDQKFISRKLLLKHTARHNEPIPALIEAKKEEIKEEVTENEPESAPVEELKVEKDKEGEKDVKAPKAEIKDEEDQDQLKKKKKRSKKNKENLDDLMDLPAPNLSESDSSEESDSEKSKLEKVVTPVPQVMLSPPSDAEANEETTNVTGTQIMDIWENFKSFQASQQAQATQEDSDDNDDAPPPPILHVNQSDHDYCMMFKPISKLTKSMSVDDLKELKPEKTEVKPEHSSPKKKQKSPRKGQRSGSESSSSGSSSSSDSSCSCGPNCSCGSSSGSSSDSSSSSDSDSSSSEGRRRAAAKRAAKLENKNKSKEDVKKPEEMKVQSPKLDTSDFVDVVSTDTKSQEIVDPDSIILESDLETEESDTDEDFYDEHPQKMANQLLTEKRKQLLMQTSLSPSHNFDIVENSRPSTPSIPEEMVKEKKVKLKKRKREKKISKTESIEPAFKPDIPSPSHSSIPMEQITALDDSTSMHMPPANTSSSPVPLEHDKSFDEDASSQPLPGSSLNMMMPAPITPRDRLSTGSSSDPDGNLKRSKRRRRPNKFYGYSSDDDGMPPGMGMGMIMTGPAAFKPTPPPNLTWRKEDLPAPSSKSSHHRSHKSSATSSKKTNSVQSTAPSLPPIPPIIIRPSALLSKKPLSVENAAYKPPIVQPIRVPPVPVHHIRPPQYVSPTRSFDDSDSSSDDDHRLTIMTPAAKKTTKTPRGRQQKSKNAKQEKQQSQSQQNKSQSYPVQQQQPQTEAAIPVKQPKPIPPALLPNPDAARIEYFKRNNIRWPIQPPAGARPPREGESVYCYCRCPYDEVSEMIACDGDDCMIEWFHFECVGILVPPQGKWFCPECRPLYPNEAGSSMEVT